MVLTSSQELYLTYSDHDQRQTWTRGSVWSVPEWSVYNQAIRTNNDVEGGHHRLNKCQ